MDGINTKVPQLSPDDELRNHLIATAERSAMEADSLEHQARAFRRAQSAAQAGLHELDAAQQPPTQASSGTTANRVFAGV